MLIRCTHCNHELRVPDQQISTSGTRVLCKNCNTIFVARRPAEEARRGSANGPEILPVADDPALEAALDRILDRTPLPGSLTAPRAVDLEAADDEDLGSSTSSTGGGADPWAQVSPESLGISLVDEESQPAALESRSQAVAHSETGDVDELLDQVLRDLDRAQPEEASALPSASARSSTPLGDALTIDGDEADAVATTSARLPEPPPMPTTTALDLDAILDELRTESAAPAPGPASASSARASDSFELTEDDFGGPTIDLEIGSDTVAKAAPAAGPSAGAPHERERSLHDIYEDDQADPRSVAEEAEDRESLAEAPRTVGAIPTRTRNVTRSVDTGVHRGAAAAKPAARKRSAAAWVAGVSLLVVAGGGGAAFWYLSRSSGASEPGEAAQPAGLPTFAFEETDGQLIKTKGGPAYVASGVVRNTSAFAVYVIQVAGVLRTSDGREVGRTASYAGNNPAVDAVSKLPRAEIEAALDTRIGEGGSNVKIEPMAALRFTLVFWNAPADAASTELSAQARSFSPTATTGG